MTPISHKHISPRQIIGMLTFCLLSSILTSCHDIPEWTNDSRGNFEALWTVLDEHYCFFEQSGVDWQEVHDRYADRIYDGMTVHMLFDVCSEMLNELHDGHVNLCSAFSTSYYRNWWSDYPQNYDERLVEQYYLGFDYRSLGAVNYAILRENIGYMSYSTFAGTIGNGNLDAILGYFYTCNGLIIDLRDNGGGDLTNCETLVSRFIDERTLVGYMVNKTGPGHNDFSEPKAYYFDPIGQQHVSWHKPVVIITNRSTFSAANNFVSIMQYLPNVRIVGDRTGGGSGIPITMEIPCGWSVRMSAVSVLDAKGLTTESGIDPSEGCKVDLDPVAALSGIDTMIERAIQVINEI